MLKQIKICMSENTSHGCNLVAYITFHRTRRELGEVPAQKYEIFQMKNFLLSDRNTPPRKPDGPPRHTR